MDLFDVVSKKKKKKKKINNELDTDDAMTKETIDLPEFIVDYFVFPTNQELTLGNGCYPSSSASTGPRFLLVSILQGWVRN